MTRFYDDENLLSIEMTSIRQDDSYGENWERDFFDVGSLPYNAELDAFKVDDVSYLSDYAESYVNGTNTDIEYNRDENGNIIPPNSTCNYTIKALRQ